METRPKLLMIDDDPAVLETYRQLLSELASSPDVRVASNGMRGLSMLEDDDYKVLICDLKMPKMDGLQVLSIVRRKFPQVRTVAITGVQDEQFRSRAYALGVDLFWYKPTTEQEMALFRECLESLLGQESDTGFRGVQSKSLVDIIQLECMSQSSSVLRISNGAITGKIWILDGELVDAEAGDKQGEEAFRRIFSWSAGSFETLPPEPSRTRTIFKAYNGLLLECAQEIDEAREDKVTRVEKVNAALAGLSEVEGLEFLIAHKNVEGSEFVSKGLENPKRVGEWAQRSLERFRALGEHLRAGPLEEANFSGLQRQVTLASRGNYDFCAGWKNTLKPEKLREEAKKIYELWTS